MEGLEESGVAGAGGGEGEVYQSRGPMPPREGCWASCIRLVDPATGATQEKLDMSSGEAALSCATVAFNNRGGEIFIVIGTAQQMVFHPKMAAAHYIHVYRLLESRLVLLHKTEVEDVPMGLCAFQGRLLAGVGKALRMYDLGKKKLLKKCECRRLCGGRVSLVEREIA